LRDGQELSPLAAISELLLIPLPLPLYALKRFQFDTSRRQVYVADTLIEYF